MTDAPNRRDELHRCEADLLWLLLPAANQPGSRYHAAVSILTDSEMQAAIIRSGSTGGGGQTEGTTAWSDPTGDAALTEAATEIRAKTIRTVWARELGEVAVAVARIRTLAADALGMDEPAQPLNLATTFRNMRWLTDTNERVLHIESDEIDHAVRWARTCARMVRQGPLTTTSGKAVPSVSSVLEAARLAMKADPPKPKPEQKAPEGCVSCRRDDGYFEPIDLKNHSARNMCRVCGDYSSGNGRMLPLDAVKYRHRTGKQLTWKIIQEAERAERAS